MISLDAVGLREGPLATNGWRVNVTPTVLAVKPSLSAFLSTVTPLRTVWAGDNPAAPVTTIPLKFASEAEARRELAAFWPLGPSDNTIPPTVFGQGLPALTQSGPVTSTADGQVIEGLDITAPDGSHGVTVTHANVTVRRCRVSHRLSDGIRASGRAVSIQDVIVNYRAPATGYDTPSGCNITVYGGGASVIERARVSGGASGVYCVDTPGVIARYIQGVDMRGPSPRGQLVQFDKCSGALLEDFSCVNDDATSWPEDVISVFKSHNVRVRRGLVDGNNSQDGVGVMFEGSNGGLCEDVDALRQLNGSFYSAGSADVMFRRCRSKGQRNADCGRGLPSSNSLTFGSIDNSSNIIFEDCSHFSQANPGNIAWGAGLNYAASQILHRDFTPRPQLNMTWAWE